MKFPKGDYRNHGPLTSVPTTLHYLGKREGYPENKTGPNRHDRRRAVHFGELRKNTLGVPVGFNVSTWNSRCADVAAAARQDHDASKGTEFVTPGKQKRYARSKDLQFKGRPGIKLIRRMVRSQGLQETIMLMHGYNRGQKRHPGYPTLGAYDRTGGRLVSPRKS